MKKGSIIFLASVVLASSVFIFASLSPQRSRLETNEEEFESISDTEARRGEYTVKLLTQPQTTYGFEIRKKDKVICLQLENPFTHTPGGFLYSNDAFNVGWWVVEQFKKTGRLPLDTAFNEGLERELNIVRLLDQK